MRQWRLAQTTAVDGSSATKLTFNGAAETNGRFNIAREQRQ
jgi:hypothetical protein